jgi:hypothetical protein
VVYLDCEVTLLTFEDSETVVIGYEVELADVIYQHAAFHFNLMVAHH